MYEVEAGGEDTEMTHMKPMSESDGEFTRVKESAGKCRQCGSLRVRCQTWESSDGVYEDFKYKCLDCGCVWWIGGRGISGVAVSQNEIAARWESATGAQAPIRGTVQTREEAEITLIPDIEDRERALWKVVSDLQEYLFRAGEQVRMLREALKEIKETARQQYPVSIGNQGAWAKVHLAADDALASTAPKEKT